MDDLDKYINDNYCIINANDLIESDVIESIEPACPPPSPEIDPLSPIHSLSNVNVIESPPSKYKNLFIKGKLSKIKKLYEKQVSIRNSLTFRNKNLNNENDRTIHERK